MSCWFHVDTNGYIQQKHAMPVLPESKEELATNGHAEQFVFSGIRSYEGQPQREAADCTYLQRFKAGLVCLERANCAWL